MSKIITVIMVSVVCLGTSDAQALILNDGGVHTIDYQLDDNVWVEDSPSDEFTTLNLIDGGIIRDWVNVFDYSQVNMSGGSIGFDLFTWNNSHAVISDGLIASDLNTFDNSDVFVFGGTIEGGLNIQSNSRLTVSGTNFAINGFPVSYGTYTASEYISGILTGTLSNGDLINNEFGIANNASITLVPEPSTLVLIGMSVLCLRRRNRKKVE
jgi:hypothetical protein